MSHLSPKQLQALLESPQKWNRLDTIKLVELLQFACLAYELTPGPATLDALRRLYRFVLENHDRDLRVATLLSLQEMLESVGRQRGTTAADAVLPFMMWDTDPQVISTGAVVYAQLVPLMHQDPMTGPRCVLAHLDRGGDPQRTAAVLGGLAALGDQRVVRLIEQQWEEIRGDEAAADLIAMLGDVMPTVAIIEFLVGRLERWLAGGQEGPIGHVVPALIHLAAAAATPKPNSDANGVPNVERTFPSWAAPKGVNPVRFRNARSVHDFGVTIMPRLARIAQAETYPRLLPKAMRAWGGDDQMLLESVKSTIDRCGVDGNASELLDVPIDQEPIPDWDRPDCVLEWGILNPFGPTRIQWCLVPFDWSRCALVYTMHHPFGPVSKLVGVARQGDDEGLRRMLLTVAGVGMLEEQPLLLALPHWVRTDPHVESYAAEFFQRLHQTAIRLGNAGGVDLDAEIAHLQRISRDPVRVINDDFKRVLNVAGPSIRKGDFDQASATLARAQMAAVPSGVKGYRKWLRTASAPEHVQVVAAEFLPCWSAANRFQADAAARVPPTAAQ
jgi:hypothetical protein